MLETMYLAILISAGLVIAAVFTSFIAFRFGAPLLLIFLGVGLLAGEDGLGHPVRQCSSRPTSSAAWRSPSSSSTAASERSFAAFRQAALPAIVMATLGVILTMAIVGPRRAARLRLHLAGVLPARGHRQLHRRRRRFLPAPGRRHSSARPCPLDAGDRVRRQRPDGDLPDRDPDRDHRRRSRRRRDGDDVRRRVLPRNGPRHRARARRRLRHRALVNRLDLEIRSLPGRRPRARPCAVRHNRARCTAAASSPSMSPASIAGNQTASRGRWRCAASRTA